MKTKEEIDQKAKAFTKELLDNIKNKRIVRGISQEDISNDLGYYRQYYGKIENGEVPLTVDTLEKIALILDVAIFELYPSLSRTE